MGRVQDELRASLPESRGTKDGLWKGYRRQQAELPGAKAELVSKKENDCRIVTHGIR